MDQSTHSTVNISLLSWNHGWIHQRMHGTINHQVMTLIFQPITFFCKQNTPESDYSSDLEKAQTYIRSQVNNDNEDDNNYEYQSSTYRDEWMLLCQLNPTYQHGSQQDEQEPDNNWESAANELPEQLLRSCPNWINTMRTLHDATWQFPEWIFISSTTNKKKPTPLILSNNTNDMQQPLLMMVLVILNQSTGSAARQQVHDHCNHRNCCFPHWWH